MCDKHTEKKKKIIIKVITILREITITKSATIKNQETGRCLTEFQTFPHYANIA